MTVIMSGCLTASARVRRMRRTPRVSTPTLLSLLDF